MPYMISLGVPDSKPHCLLVQQGTAKRAQSDRRRQGYMIMHKCSSRLWVLLWMQRSHKVTLIMLSPESPGFPVEQDNLRNLSISNFCHAVQVARINGNLYSPIHDPATLFHSATQIPTVLQNAPLKVPTAYFS